jgi:RNA polymerase-binding transcription factor DksA
MKLQSSVLTHRADSAGPACRVEPWRLQILQWIMEDQLAFRRLQLAQLSGELAVGPARQAVNDIIAGGARRTLDEIERALIRLRTGEYGSCVACGADIPSLVLDVVPWAACCPDCHRARDQRNEAGSAT